MWPRECNRLVGEIIGNTKIEKRLELEHTD